MAAWAAGGSSHTAWPCHHQPTATTTRSRSRQLVRYHESMTGMNLSRWRSCKWCMYKPNGLARVASMIGFVKKLSLYQCIIMSVSTSSGGTSLQGIKNAASCWPCSVSQAPCTLAPLITHQACKDMKPGA